MSESTWFKNTTKTMPTNYPPETEILAIMENGDEVIARIMDFDWDLKGDDVVKWKLRRPK